MPWFPSRKPTMVDADDIPQQRKETVRRLRYYLPYFFRKGSVHPPPLNARNSPVKNPVVQQTPHHHIPHIPHSSHSSQSSHSSHSSQEQPEVQPRKSQVAQNNDMRIILDNNTLNEMYLNSSISQPDMSFLLSIETIYLTEPLKDTNKRNFLLYTIAPNLKNITKVILGLEIEDIIALLEQINVEPITHLILKNNKQHIDIGIGNQLTHLVNIITTMKNIKYLELSKFNIEVRDDNEYNEVFKGLLKKKGLTHFNFYNNIFYNHKKYSEYDNLINGIYIARFEEKIKHIIQLAKWVFKQEQPINDRYKYKKWLEYTLYKLHLSKKTEKTNEVNKIISEIDKVGNEAYEDSLYYKDSPYYKAFNIKVANDLNEWFEWLLSNYNNPYNLDYDNDDIIKRLTILIDYYKNNEDLYRFLISLEKGIKDNIIKKYDETSHIIIPKYKPSSDKLTEKYNDLIINMNLITFSTSTITKPLNTVAVGGRKTKSKSRKQPKKAREEPKKPLNKPPKKPTKKVALKEPNVYGVIKHKIKI